ncbi:uncharacterized protein BJX67DRAFT_386490 [Aspergillus lucknowensis]|uniref:GRF-type domain-containing protein n=1 Tax=Aspergillus lucknowensis TaxID=176173 RepID=A0ABR4L618_9EURO
MSGLTLRSTYDGVQLDGDGEFLCNCGFPTRKYHVKKKTSPYHGLQYYACAKHGSDSTRCHTWIWFDEKEPVSRLIPPAMRSPRTPCKQVDIRQFGQYTPPTSLKRRAESQSFDNDMGDSGDIGEPGPPSPSRSAKRVKNADAATQTKDVPLRPAIGPLPKRRLFEDVLGHPRDNCNGTIGAPTRPEPKSQQGLFVSPAGGIPVPQAQEENPVPPPDSIETRPATLPPAEQGAPQPEVANSPTASHANSNGIDPVDVDSDAESYGWDDELERGIIDIANSVENPVSSPLFV